MAAEMSPKKYMCVFLNKGSNRWEFAVRYKGAVYRGSSQTQIESALAREVEIFRLKLKEELKAKRNFPEKNEEEIKALLAEIKEARIAEANLMEERRAFADKKSVAEQQFSPSSSSYVTNELLCVPKERDTVEEIFRTLQDAFDQLTIYMPSDSNEPQDHSSQHESELRDDRDRQVAKVQALAAKFAKLPACIKNIMTVKSNELKELQNRLEEAQIRIQEGDKRIQEGDNLREKLHNTILLTRENMIQLICAVADCFPVET